MFKMLLYLKVFTPEHIFVTSDKRPQFLQKPDRVFPSRKVLDENVEVTLQRRQRLVADHGSLGNLVRQRIKN